MTSASVTTPEQAPWPTEIRLVKDRTRLIVSFEDGSLLALPAELLRVMSPSAELRGHSEAERQTVGGKRNVRLLSVEPVGNYAVKLSFDDGHATGIYTFPFLHDLGLRRAEHFAAYERELAEKGLDRDRPGQR